MIFGSIWAAYKFKSPVAPQKVKEDTTLETHIPTVNLEEVKDHFEQNNCTIWLFDLKSEDSHRVIKTCGHLFLSKWMEEYYQTSQRSRRELLWPLCKANIENVDTEIEN